MGGGMCIDRDSIIDGGALSEAPGICSVRPRYAVWCSCLL